MEMMIRNLLETMGHHDLVSLRQNVQKGNFNFNTLLKNTITMKENENVKYCSMCGNDLEPQSTSNYTIMFGPEGFKKKASFCALDCMEFFVGKLKEIKNNQKEEQHLEN